MCGGGGGVNISYEVAVYESILRRSVWKGSREPAPLTFNRFLRIGHCVSNSPHCCGKAPRTDTLRKGGTVLAPSLGDDGSPSCQERQESSREEEVSHWG